MTARKIDTPRILNDETLFGDGDPTWRNAPTAVDAAKKHQAVIKRLRRFAPDFEGAEDLAETLLPCRPYHRCGSAACPQCAPAMQRWLVHQILKLARKKP